MTHTVVIGSEEFKTDLAQFTSTIATVSSSRDAVEADLNQLESLLSGLTESWQSPAGAAYAELQSALMGAAKKLSSVLDEMVSRMKITNQTYLNAELANTKNLNIIPAPTKPDGIMTPGNGGTVPVERADGITKPGNEDTVPQAPTRPAGTDTVPQALTRPTVPQALTKPVVKAGIPTAPTVRS